jgi:outer membrane murein-binding lipoprotein Lpp
VNTLRKTYPLLLTGLVVVAIVAPMAQGTGSADRVSVLEKKVKALTARVATLESQAAATKNDVSAAKGDIATAKSDIATVQGKVTALENGGAALQSALTAVQSSVGGLTTCLRYKVLPMTDYDGYLYTPDGNKVGVTTALDITDSGQTPQGYAALMNPSCVGASNVMRPAAQIQAGVTAFNTR